MALTTRHRFVSMTPSWVTENISAISKGEKLLAAAPKAQNEGDDSLTFLPIVGSMDPGRYRRAIRSQEFASYR